MPSSVSSSAQVWVRGSRHERGFTPHPRLRRFRLRVPASLSLKGRGEIQRLARAIMSDVSRLRHDGGEKGRQDAGGPRKKLDRTSVSTNGGATPERKLGNQKPGGSRER